MKHFFRIGEQMAQAALAGPADARRLLAPDGEHAVALRRRDDGSCEVRVDGARHRVFLAGDEDCWFIHIDGDVYEVSVQDPLSVHAHKGAAAAGLHAKAPMPGSVVALPVAVGDAVHAGATLVIIESMKLEVAIKAECGGSVEAIHVALGQTFDKNAVLVTLAALVEG